MVLVASPFLLLVSPCLLLSKCMFHKWEIFKTIASNKITFNWIVVMANCLFLKEFKNQKKEKIVIGWVVSWLLKSCALSKRECFVTIITSLHYFQYAWPNHKQPSVERIFVMSLFFRATDFVCWNKDWLIDWNAWGENAFATMILIGCRDFAWPMRSWGYHFNARVGINTLFKTKTI